MKKLLFISGNRNHSAMFSGMARVLKKTYACEILTLDSIKKEEANIPLDSGNIPNQDIKEFGSINCIKILKVAEPDLIILGCDYSPVEQAFVLAARHLGIKTLLTQDGIIASNKIKSSSGTVKKVTGQMSAGLRSFISTYMYLLTTSLAHKRFGAIAYLCTDMRARLGNTHTYGLAGCNKIAVYSDGQKKVFIDNGINSEKIAITGKPMFMDPDGKEKVRTQLQKILGTVPDNLVLIATSPVWEMGKFKKEDRKHLWNMLTQAAQKRKELTFLVKLHPREDLNAAEADLKDTGLHIARNMDILPLIEQSAIVSTEISTVGYEAMILGKPLIVTDLQGIYEDEPLSREKGVQYTKNIEEFIEALDRVHGTAPDYGLGNNDFMGNISKLIHELTHTK